MILFLPVYPLAARTALMTASVPEFTMRTISTDGTMLQISLAISTSASVAAPKLKPLRQASITFSSTMGLACPRIIGPQEPT